MINGIDGWRLWEGLYELYDELDFMYHASQLTESLNTQSYQYPRNEVSCVEPIPTGDISSPFVRSS